MFTGCLYEIRATQMTSNGNPIRFTHGIFADRLDLEDEKTNTMCSQCEELIYRTTRCKGRLKHASQVGSADCSVQLAVILLARAAGPYTQRKQPHIHSLFTLSSFSGAYSLTIA